MEVGTLTEVTDSKNKEMIAYIVPLSKETKKGLYEIKVLWLSEYCKIQPAYSYKLKNQNKNILYHAYRHTHNLIVILFSGVGKGHICVPRHNQWIHYNTVDDKKLPIYLGMSNALDDFIAHQLAGQQNNDGGWNK